MAATSKCKKNIREDGSGVDFVFSHGETLAVNINELSEKTVNQLVCHGISQKIGDSYAGADSVEDAHKSANEMSVRLAAGEWKTVRSGGAAKTPTLLVEAMMRALNRSHEDVVELLEDKSTEDRSALQNHQQIKPFILEVKIELEQAKLAKAQEAAAATAAEGEEPGPSLADMLS